MRRSFIQEELLLNQLKLKQIPPKFHFATLTLNNPIKPVHFSVENETVLPSKKVHRYPISELISSPIVLLLVIENNFQTTEIVFS